MPVWALTLELTAGRTMHVAAALWTHHRAEMDSSQSQYEVQHNAPSSRKVEKLQAFFSLFGRNWRELFFFLLKFAE